MYVYPLSIVVRSEFFVAVWTSLVWFSLRQCTYAKSTLPWSVVVAVDVVVICNKRILITTDIPLMMMVMMAMACFLFHFFVSRNHGHHHHCHHCSSFSLSIYLSLFSAWLLSCRCITHEKRTSPKWKKMNAAAAATWIYGIRLNETNLMKNTPADHFF